MALTIGTEKGEKERPDRKIKIKKDSLTLDSEKREYKRRD